MDPKAIIGIVVALALFAAGYLWYTNQPSALPPQVQQNNQEPTAEEPSAATIATGIEGTWRSRDDAKFTRSFGEDGRVIDRYEGESSVSGHYEVNGDEIPVQVRQIAGDDPVLSIEFPEESLFFLVTKVDADELELVYIGGNGVLRFDRI